VLVQLPPSPPKPLSVSSNMVTQRVTERTLNTLGEHDSPKAPRPMHQAK
jgi:hypothetical protein